MKKNNIIYTIIALVLAVLFGYVVNKDNYSRSILTEDLIVQVVDVGQGDCILISTQKHNMLIDAGNNEDGEKLVQYFESLGIKEFDYVVGTHPHEDHIGGLDNILKSIPTKKVLLSDVTTTTKTFEEVIDVIEEKNIELIIPTIGKTYKLGDAVIEVIYLDDNEEDLNESSMVLKLTYGNTSFLFTADSTSESEKKYLDKNIEADVLKVSHHGSTYSTSNAFLDKVKPKYAIISVAKQNDYYLPHEGTINRLKKHNAKIYQTKDLGTIIINSDGENITIDHQKTNTNG